jgi:hypothetical protein
MHSLQNRLGLGDARPVRAMNARMAGVARTAAGQKLRRAHAAAQGVR